MRLHEVQDQEATQSQYSPLRNQAVVDKIRQKATQAFGNFQRIEYDGFRMFEAKRRVAFSEIEKMRMEYEQLIGSPLYTRAYTYTLEPMGPGEQETVEGGPEFTPIMQSVTFYLGQVPAHARVRYEIKT